jgi:hypothetical protein
MSSSFARLVAGYVEHYNNVRLNGAVGYITPKDLLTGRQQEIHAGRDRKVGGGTETAADSSAERLREERRAEYQSSSSSPVNG